MSNKIIKPPDTSLAPRPGFEDDGKRHFVFRGRSLIQDRAKSRYYKIINIYIVYDLQSNLNYYPDFTLGNCLFGGRVTITKNADVSKFKYSWYGNGFDGKGVFTHTTGSFANNPILFGVDMSSSIHIDNKKRTFKFSENGQRQG